jgi:hypothetical protein
MDHTCDLHIVTQLAADMPSGDPCGCESPVDDSCTLLHPKHHIAKSVTSVLRKLALFLLVGGAVGAILWRADFRQPGALSGTANGIVIGVLMGAIILAVAVTVVAYVIDLLFLFDWNAKFVPLRSDEYG